MIIDYRIYIIGVEIVYPSPSQKIDSFEQFGASLDHVLLLLQHFVLLFLSRSIPDDEILKALDCLIHLFN
jgi:hypothetical protein